MPHGAVSETHSLRFIQDCTVQSYCRSNSADEQNGCDTCNTDLGHTALPGTVCFDTGSLYQLQV